MDARLSYDRAFLEGVVSLDGNGALEHYVAFRDNCLNGVRTYVFDMRNVSMEAFTILDHVEKRRQSLYYIDQSGYVRRTKHTEFLNQSIESVVCMILDGFTPGGPKCECGTKAPPSQNHSQWCKLFRSEF